MFKMEADMKSEETKERIIHETIQLIKEMKGEIEKVTIRKIADKAQVGVGLINHYFKSKDNLIQISVQRIIKQVVTTFEVTDIARLKPMELTKTVACQVVDFLMENLQISKVSILEDLNNPKEKDNSIQTAIGFAYCMSGGVDLERYRKKAFFLLSILQESFLRKDVLYSNIGVDFENEEQRKQYINDIIEMIMGGMA